MPVKNIIPLVSVFIFLFVCLASKSQTNGEQQLWQTYRTAKDSTERVHLLIKISESCFQRDRLYSESLAERAFTLSKTLSDKVTEMEALIRLINVTFDNSNNPKAVALTNQLLLLSEAVPQRRLLPEIHRIAGRNYHLRGDYSMALNHYFKGLTYSEENKDTVAIGELYNIIGGIYFNQGDSKNAYAYYNRGLQIQQQLNNKLRIGRGYLNVGSAHIIAHDYNKARAALDSALVNYKRANYEEGVMMVYTTLPDIFIATQQDDSALKYLNKAYAFLKNRNRTFYIPQIDLQVARILLKRNNTNEAIQRIEAGLVAGHANRQNHDLAPLYLLKSEVLEKQGKPEEALSCYKIYKALSDSVINATSIKKQTEEALNYDYSKKAYQQQLELKQKESRRNFILLASSILVLLLFFAFYYRYRLKQRANKLLEHTNARLAEKNTLIEEKSKALQEALHERELLLKEIHHRVKNNLQVISGLLELQKEELTEDGSKAAFDEGQSRIRSISLIHQNLYQNEKLGSIKFKTFVSELADQVKEVFEQNNQQVKLEVDMPDNVMDIDTAVPLGLILNELLTNSYKYALTVSKQGLICITLTNKGQGNFLLVYKDNGPGIKADTNFDNAGSLGLRLIKGLSDQLAGKATYRYEDGAVFEIVFKDSGARMHA